MNSLIVIYVKVFLICILFEKRIYICRKKIMNYKFIQSIIIDYIRPDDAKKISLFEIQSICKFIYENNFENILDIYIYIDNKLNLNYKLWKHQ